MCRIYQYAVGEAGDEGVLDRDGRQLDRSDMAGKNLSKGAKGVFGHEGEDPRACQEPKLLGFQHELLIEVAGAGDRSHVIGTGSENGGGSLL